MAKATDAFDDAWAANIDPSTRKSVDDWVARYEAGEDMNDPTGRNSLDGDEWAILERLHPDVVAEYRADGEAQWAASIAPSTRSRVDDWVARFEAGEDMNDPTGRGVQLEGDEWAILERLHPGVVAEYRVGADADWAANIAPSTRKSVDDWVARYQAGEDMNDPTGRNSLDGDEWAILERLHPDVVAEYRATEWAANIDPSTRKSVDDWVARYQAGEDMNDPTGRNSLDGDEWAILERLHPEVVAEYRADAGMVVPEPPEVPPVAPPGPSAPPAEVSAAEQAAIDASNEAWAREQDSYRFPNDEVQRLYDTAADLAQSVADGSVTQAEADAAWNAWVEADQTARAERAEYVAGFPNEEIADLAAVVNQLSVQVAAASPMNPDYSAVIARYSEAAGELQAAYAEAAVAEDALGVGMVQADVDATAMQAVVVAPTDVPEPVVALTSVPAIPDEPTDAIVEPPTFEDVASQLESPRPEDLDLVLTADDEDFDGGPPDPTIDDDGLPAL